MNNKLKSLSEHINEKIHSNDRWTETGIACPDCGKELLKNISSPKTTVVSGRTPIWYYSKCSNCFYEGEL